MAGPNEITGHDSFVLNVIVFKSHSLSDDIVELDVNSYSVS